MTPTKSNQSRRQIKLARAVIEAGGMTVDELAAVLDVSPVTVYRDVTQLEAEGVVKLDRGNVVPTSSTVVEMSSSMRAEVAIDAKLSFASAVGSIIPRGASIIVDDSSSALPALDVLVAKAPVTIITNSLAVLKRIGKNASVEVHLVGGRYVSWSDAFYGPSTVQAISQFRPDFCLMSDAAIFDGCVCNPYDYVVETKRAMLAAAAKSILVADETKFHRRALLKTARLVDFDYVITDRPLGGELSALCEESGTQIIVTQASVAQVEKRRRSPRHPNPEVV